MGALTYIPHVVPSLELENHASCFDMREPGNYSNVVADESSTEMANVDSIPMGVVSGVVMAFEFGTNWSVLFSGGKPSGPAEDVVTGFLDASGRTHGRPVGLAIDRSGSLLIADDVGNTVWRVSSDHPASASKPGS